MPLADDLWNPATVQIEGTTYAAGWVDDAYWIEYSIDHCRTKALFADRVSTRRQIVAAVLNPATEEIPRPDLEAYLTREVLFMLNLGGTLYAYVSRDGGESWEEVVGP